MFLHIASLSDCQPQDVCLNFSKSSKRIWASSRVLTKASPFFRSLLSSGFAEGSGSTMTAHPVNPHFPYTFDDSDAEDDGKPEEETAKKTNIPVPSGVKVVNVTDTAHSTYFAVLVWISTEVIEFAPIRSTFYKEIGNSDTAQARAARTAAVKALRDRPQTEEFTVASPRSVYRLAHLLELHDLAKLALENYAHQLTISGVLYELFSDVSYSYPDVQELVLNYVVKNWENAKKTKSWKVIQARAGCEGAPRDAGIVAMKLAGRLPR
ncbi:uncharacterized protein JCM15063_006067 [Sporobolomyces koalae]|uniref:uncharacterized protein n=1 Tax=Sporobolomyces koalae TaxID=500713 RepID=UPI0031774EBC